jgi:uncharacterized protein (TIGR03663 family)
MPSALQRWLPLALVALLALGLRAWDLDRRPMHADEANQAVKAGELLEGRGYAFDSADHHGPTLYYATLPVAWLRGERTLAQLTETTVRLVPALAGTAAVVLLHLFALPLGRWPALAAAAFLALSPPAVYYSRYFIQETLLLAFVLGALLCARHWWRDGGLGWVIGAGLFAGLMQATKSSAPLFLVAALVGLAAIRPGRPATRRLRRDVTVSVLTALVVAGLFYSSFGSNFRGLADAFSTYVSFGNRLAGDTGHEKTWWYYLSLFGWRRDGGVLAQQILFTALALAGFIIALISNRRPFLRWVAVFTVAVGLVLSFTAYKTPWHCIHFVPGFALLAAGALAALPDRTGCRLIAAGLALGVAASQAQQVRLTSFQRPADERNPYAYVHTAPDVLKVRPLVLAASSGPIRVISEEVWPLPWYLRGLPNVGYWTTVPEDCDGSLVIASAGLAEQVHARLQGDYRTRFVGLRPGFVLVVFTRQP